MAEIGALSRVTGGVAGCDEPLDLREKISGLKMARKWCLRIETNSKFSGGRVWAKKFTQHWLKFWCSAIYLAEFWLVPRAPVIPAVAEAQNSSTGSQVTPPAELIEMVQYTYSASNLCCTALRKYQYYIKHELFSRISHI